MKDRRATAAVWSLFVAVAVVSGVLVLRRPPGDRLSDLHIYYGAAQTVGAGLPLYDYVADNGGPFTYPPFAVLVLRPLTLVPEAALRIVWLVLVCAAVAAIAAAVARGRSRAVVAATACALLVSAPAQSNLRFGQVSVFIVLLALVDALGLTPTR
ncbi:MAG TPA: glycosyltransferase 87 family protein, partial [Asanoa sp.]